MNTDNVATYHVGFLLIDGFALMSYSAACEPLRAANVLAGKPLYAINNISATGHSASSSSGAVIRNDITMNRLPELDMLLVVAGGDPTVFSDSGTFQRLRRFASAGLVLGGVSGGPVVLARAGVMKGRRMTVHWEHRPLMEEEFPDLLLEKSLYLKDRDRMTCAGGIAALDMMHALITEHHGSAFARKVSEWFMHTDIRPAERPQRAGLVERYGVNNAAVVATIEAMENHIADVLDLSKLAQVVGISERQLSRLFRENFACSTMSFYRDLRLQKGASLLRQTSLSITDIALTTGFNSSSHFSMCFKKRFNCSPNQLRKVHPAVS